MSIIGICSINKVIDDVVNMRLPYTYIDCIKQAGGTPLIIPMVDEVSMKEVLETIDGLVIPGGDDIDPIFYNDVLRPYTNGIDKSLDQFQQNLVQEALKINKPILGICRGHQVLNVALGGTLYQDLCEYPQNLVIHDQMKNGYGFFDKVHEVYFEKDSLLEKIYGEKMLVNSFHHQMVKDVGKNLKVIGYTKDGLIEALESTVHRFALSVQWHPERSSDQHPLFKLFVEACER